MGATAAAAAAAAIRREQHIVDRFRALGAISPDSARTLAELQVEQRIAWRRLTENAVIRSASDGRYYFDEPSWLAAIKLRRRVAALVLTIAVVVALTASIAIILSVRH